MTISNRPKKPLLNRPLFPPVMAPTVSHPLVDDFTLRAQRMRARSAPQGLQVVQPLPLRNHPMWSGNSELGSSLTFAADRANNEQFVLKMEEWGEPQVWSVMLGTERPATDPVTGLPAFDYQIIADVTVGVGGATQQFEVDWDTGMSFSVVANTIVVNAKYDAFGAGVAIGTTQLLSATVAKGKITDLPPTRSRFVRTGGIGAVTFVRIPKFARRLRILAGDTIGGLPNDFFAATTTFEIVPAVTTSEFSYTGPSFETLTTGAAALPLPPNMQFISVSTAAVSEIFGIFVFELGL